MSRSLGELAEAAKHQPVALGGTSDGEEETAKKKNQRDDGWMGGAKEKQECRA